MKKKTQQTSEKSDPSIYLTAETLLKEKRENTLNPDSSPYHLIDYEEETTTEVKLL